jgi:hypothetical protein
MKRREFIAALGGVAARPFAAVKPIAALPCLDWRLALPAD